jgi:hypothetical protein
MKINSFDTKIYCNNVLKYDTYKYNFRDIVCEYLNTKNLESISLETTDILSKKTDQSTLYHKAFYHSIDHDTKFKELYDKFIVEFISPLFKQKFIYQTFPTFRVHYKKNIAVFEFHKDKDYNHNPKTINFFLPLTKCYDTNTIWIETEEDKGDYYPIICDYGNLVIWDGANLRHGNKINETNQTRVSLDFRILMEKDYSLSQQKDKMTLKNKKLIVGQYYQKLM